MRRLARATSPGEHRTRLRIVELLGPCPNFSVPFVGVDDAGHGRRGLRARPSTALLAALRDHYGLVPTAGNLDLGGSSNLNLRVTDGDERFVARVYRRYVTAPRLAAIQLVRNELVQSGLPCSTVVPTRAGGPWIVSDGRLVEVERHVGHDAEMDDWERLEAGMPVLGRIHTVLRSVAVGPEGRKPLFANHIEPDDVLPASLRGTSRIRAWGPTEEDLELAASAEELARRLDDVGGNAVRRLPRQLVHGDFWDNNVFFRQGRVVLVTDFDFMGERARIDDLGLTLYFAIESFVDGALSEDDMCQLRRLVDAYEQGLERPLSGEERAALPIVLARQPLWSIGGWIVLLDHEASARFHAAGMHSAIARASGMLANLDVWRDVFA